MAISLDDLCGLAAKGAVLVINQQHYTEQDLMALGAVVQAYKGTLLFLSTHERAVAEAQSSAKFSELYHRAQEGKVLTIDIDDLRRYPQADLLVLTALAKEWGSRLYLLNAHTRDTRELARIAEKAGKFVTFDLSQ